MLPNNISKIAINNYLLISVGLLYSINTVQTLRYGYSKMSGQNKTFSQTQENFVHRKIT